jgi:glyoxylase-like metal-dependent hydrolase (beta-lactamase superfamily II)
MQLFPVLADLWKMDGGVAFGVVPKSIWNRNSMADENNMIPIVTRCLLIQTDERLILVDAGMGNKRDEKYYKVRFRDPSVNLPDSLKEVGFLPADITDIILTHLHDDHVGGVISRDEGGKLVEVFPNARYYCSASQWDWANHPNKREGASYFPDNLIPILESGKLELIEKEQEFSEGIYLRIFDGHTSGQLIPLIDYLGRTIIFSGDFIPTAFNVPLPFVPAVDIRPLISMQEKAAFLDEAVDEEFVMLFEHDYFNECCTFKKVEKKIQVDQCFQIKDLNN